MQLMPMLSPEMVSAGGPASSCCSNPGLYSGACRVPVTACAAVLRGLCPALRLDGLQESTCRRGTEVLPAAPPLTCCVLLPAGHHPQHGRHREGTGQRHGLQQP